jgi:hypothetical protein
MKTGVIVIDSAEKADWAEKARAAGRICVLWL